MKCPISGEECDEVFCAKHGCAEALNDWAEFLGNLGYAVAQSIGAGKIAKEKDRQRRLGKRAKKG
ncbi:hypothetical protein KC614_02425 [candidate division WWE3 bacterium]|uniref:Uncharacterized protein n=1 Tax=candidate division WWE3 bacterium TaxID=2053526 RepID=A0A955RRY6_UNCKA|nr:hypothetical protein [candidate division WWE3 bacterium]